MNVVKVDERIDTLIFTFSNQVKPPVIRKPPNAFRSKPCHGKSFAVGETEITTGNLGTTKGRSIFDS